MNLARTRITNLCEQCRRRDLRFYHQQSGSCTSGSSVDKLPVGAVKQSDAQLTCKHKKKLQQLIHGYQMVISRDHKPQNHIHWPTIPG